MIRARRQRGAVAIIVAILLPVLAGIAALAIDAGHLYLVRSQLQNAADGAAIAGARTLDGTLAQLSATNLAAQKIASSHMADGTPVKVDLNASNRADGDIVLGHWHVEANPPWFEVVADPTLSPPWIDAVQVRTYRTAASGGAVKSFLAQLIGVTQGDVAAHAIAVGGGPVSECAFPLAIPDCVIRQGNAAPKCGVTLKFRNDINDNAGLTNLAPSGAVNPPVVTGLINDARNGVCHAPVTGGAVALQNGDPINPIAQAINDWIAANGGPITVTVPILQTGPGGGCNVKFNQSIPVAGFARIQIVKVWPPGGKDGNTIDIVLLCNQSQDSVAGGGFFGDRANLVYLTQ